MERPTASEEEEVSRGVCRRVERLFKRLDKQARDEEVSPDVAVVEASSRVFPVQATKTGKGKIVPVPRGTPPTQAGYVMGFSVHAGVSAAAHEIVKKRNLVKYCLRPPFAEKQVQERGDGRVAFELKKPRSNGATHVLFSEMGFVAKLAALVPPPRQHQIRFFGVLSSAAKARSAVVPAKPIELPAVDFGPQEESPFTVARRISWASLLKRVFDIDALACPKCLTGRLKVIAAITKPAVVQAILVHVGLDDEPQARGPPRQTEEPYYDL